MYRHTQQRTLMSLAVASACSMFAMPAWAQQAAAQEATQEAPLVSAPDNSAAAAPAAPAPAAAGEMQTVVVQGTFRSSLERSLDLKRSAITTRDSIVAEDIGKFPEQNIADAMVRLPGVEVVKDGASNEGQRIQLRGLSSEYTVTTFNGAPVRATSAGNIGGASRDFNYDVFASEMFGRVDVYKAPLAELEEGGVAGVVDLQTPRPFDKKGRVIRYSAAAAHNSKSGEKSPRAHFLFSNTWGNFGVLASVARARTKNANSGFQSTGIYNSTNQRTIPGNATFTYNLADPRANLGSTTLAELFDANLPRFFRLTTTDNVRDRVSVNTSVQYKTADLDLSWDLLSSNLKDDTKNNYFNFPMRDSIGARALVPINVTVDKNNNLQGSLGNVTMISNGLTGKSETDFMYNALNAKYRVSDKMRLTGQIGANKSEAWRSDATMTAEGLDAASRHTITFNTTDDAMYPDLSTDRDLLDPKIYTSFGYNGSYRTETDKQQVAKLVMDYDYEFGGVEARLKVGLSRVESTKEARSFTTGNLLNGLTIPGVGLYSAATPAQRVAFAQSKLIQNELSNVKTEGNLPKNWLTFDRNFVYTDLDALNANRAAPANLGGTFDAVETIDAFFIQSDFETQLWDRPLRTNVGVRYVKTSTDIDNYKLSGTTYVPNHLESSYTNALPSASFAYDLMPDLVWRGSFGKTITRSSISAIARSLAVPNNGDLVVNAGNPDLKPQSSKNFDTSVEWYFEKGAILAASAFHKKVEGRPASQSFFVPFDSLGLPKELFTTNIQATLTATPSSPVELRQFRNAEEFKIRGLEIAYQQNYKFLPAPFNNIGSIVSMTNIKTAGVSRTYNAQVYELPIVPERTYALTLYYENGPLSLRTSYNHKSEYANFNNTSVNPLGYQRWFNARGYLDASIAYKFSDAFELRLDGSNLSNTRTYEVLRHFEGRNGDEESRLEGANLAGRTLTLSVRGKF